MNVQNPDSPTLSYNYTNQTGITARSPSGAELFDYYESTNATAPNGYFGVSAVTGSSGINSTMMTALFKPGRITEVTIGGFQQWSMPVIALSPTYPTFGSQYAIASAVQLFPNPNYAARDCTLYMQPNATQPVNSAVDPFYVNGYCPSTPVPPHAVATGRFGLLGVAANGGNVYWAENTNPGGVFKVSVGGSVTSLSSNRFGVLGVATDGVNAYWVENTNPGGVLKVPVDGGAVTSVVSGRFGVLGVATDGVNVYWVEDTNPGGVLKAPVNGGAITSVVSGRFGVLSVATDGVNVYWTESSSGAVLKAPVNGGAITTLISGLLGVTGVATDGLNVYWSENLNPGVVMKVPVVGGTPVTLDSGPFGLLGVGVDGTNVYWVEDTNPGQVMSGPQ